MAKKILSFEESMERLEEIIGSLEQNNMNLDDTILLFEEGLDLVKSCDMKLKEFEKKIDEITKKNGDKHGEDNEF